MRGVPAVHPEFMLEPVFDNLGAGRDAIGLARAARPASTPATARC